MKIYIDNDHNGYELKYKLMKYLVSCGYEVMDVGTPKRDPEDDYPYAASRVINAMRSSDDPFCKGILICGSGQGVCMAANRFKGIRASLCWDNWEARAARNDDDSNVLCLPGRVLSEEKAKVVTDIWLKTPFSGVSRYKRRINELDEI